MTDQANGAADEDLNLTIDADTPENQPVNIAVDGDKAEVVAEAAPVVVPAAGDIPGDEGVDSLRRQLQQERTRADTAETEKQRLARENDNARVEVVDGRYQQVLGAIDKAKRDGDAAEAAYAKAMEEGNYAEAAKAQRIMARITNYETQLEGAKAQFEDAAKRQKPPTAEGRVDPKPQAPVDHVEAFAASLSPDSAAWVRAHPEYVRDEALNADMIAADKHARKLNIKADTPEYFAFVEKRLGIGNSDDVPAVTTQTARVATPAAPVSRGTPSLSTGQAPRTVTLSAAERDMARAMDMTDTEYAIEKVKIERERASGALN